MLALLCTIYRQDGYIPRYRPDAYEKCAIMLFEKWDKSRNIYSPPLPEEHVRPLIEYIANWIYADAQLRAGITETALTKKAIIYLHEELYEDRHKAERVAHEFITFCTGRAWVFIDTGTQKDGENLYQFAHATFLEYFAASHLVRASRSPSSLLKVLVPHIAKQEWDVMAQLAFQLYSKQNAGASDELLMALVKTSQNRKSEAKLNLLSFAVRCLQFIIPRPNARRAITKVCIEQCITWGSEQLKMGASQEDIGGFSKGKFPGEIFDDFSDLIDENNVTILETIQTLLIEYISNNDDNTCLIAIEIAMYIRRDPINFQKTSDDVFMQCRDRIMQLSSKSLLLSQYEVWNNRMSMEDFIRLYGCRGLFIDSKYIIAGHSGRVSIFRWLIKIPTLLNDNNYIKSNGGFKSLTAIGASLLSAPLPLLERKDILSSFRDIEFMPKESMSDLDTGMLFGLFCMLAVFAEINNNFEESEIASIENKRHLHLQNIHPVYALLYARRDDEIIGSVQHWLDQCHFIQQQQDFIWRWIRKEISLVAPDETNQDDNQEQP